MKEAGTVGTGWSEAIEEREGQIMRLMAISQSWYDVVYFVWVLVGSTLYVYFISALANF